MLRARAHRALLSFPTRRSSDLAEIFTYVKIGHAGPAAKPFEDAADGEIDAEPADIHGLGVDLDRKSTRLNSSHITISYAVFCLKKKKRTKDTPAPPPPSPTLRH